MCVAGEDGRPPSCRATPRASGRTLRFHRARHLSALCALHLLTVATAQAVPPSFSFGDRRSYPVDQMPSLTGASTIAAGNFNGDIYPDIAALGEDADGFATVVLLLGQRDGNFLIESASLPFTDQLFDFDAIAAGNFDVRMATDDLALLVPDLEGVDRLEVLPNLGGSPVLFQQPNNVFGVGDAPSGIFAVDFTGDGSLDLAVPDTDSGLIYLARKSGQNFIQSAPLPTGRDLSDLSNIFSGPVAVAAGLLNTDTLPDLAVALSDDQGVAVHLNAGSITNPSFGVPTVYDRNVETSHDLGPTGVVVADFNHDNHPDIALSNEGSATGSGAGAVTIHFNQGDGTFTDAVTYNVTEATADGLVVADFNGDGNPDIVTRNGDDTISVLLGNADGTFYLDPNLLSISVGAGLAGLVVADFNKDGKPDVAIAEEVDNTVSILLGGGVSPPTFTPTRTGTPTRTPTVTTTGTVTRTFTATQTFTATPPITVTRTQTATASPTPTSTATRPPTATPFVAPAGDADCNGVVNRSDLPALNAQLFFDPAPACTGSDANHDGAVTAADVPATTQLILSQP